MIDVLAVTLEGHLAVLELKADEDIHLPLQGVDYWSLSTGIIGEASSSASGTFQDVSYRLTRRSYCLWHPRCIFIPPQTLCCATSHPRSTGRLWALTSGGEMACG